MVFSQEFNVGSKGNTDIIDITHHVEQIVKKSKIGNGQALVFVIGSTASITTIEYEPGLVKDFKDIYDKLIPEGKNYAHDNAWHDGNGHSHLRASTIGPSEVFPLIDNNLILGTWQQIILVDFDTRSRQRRVVVQINGE